MQKASTIFTVVNAFMGMIFLFCVAVQYNDPDPLAWMAIYGLAALVCILYFFNRLPWFLSLFVGGVSLVWAALIFPRIVSEPLPWNQVFGTMEMISTAVEETREMGGLLIVAGWMMILTWRSRRRSHS